MSCDSDSDDNCGNCKSSPEKDQQCCALCPSTNERCKRKAVVGQHRCRQHGEKCRQLHSEYKEICKDLLELKYKDLDDDEFYMRYKSVQKCLSKRQEQTRLCYPGKNTDCYYNEKHDNIFKKYTGIINKYQKRFDKLDEKREKEKN